MKKQLLLIFRGLILGLAAFPLANCASKNPGVGYAPAQASAIGGYVSGGTRETSSLDTGDYTFVSPEGLPTTSPSVARGLRFGNDSISRNSVDRLMAEEGSTQKTKTNRTGLATQAGRDTWSSLSDIPFYRKRTGQPDAVDSFHYNDEAGAKAMAEALGGGSKRSGSFSMAGGRVDVSLRPLWGSAYPRYEAAGRKIVVGDSGDAYKIFLTNRMKHAVEVVASVDGLNVMDGRTASVTKTGYVIPAKGELAIEGFRKNRNQVKQFLFGSVDESAAARKGQARNVGVIGLAVYDEDEAQAKLARLVESQKRSAANPFGGQ